VSTSRLANITSKFPLPDRDVRTPQQGSRGHGGYDAPDFQGLVTRRQPPPAPLHHLDRRIVDAWLKIADPEMRPPRNRRHDHLQACSSSSSSRTTVPRRGSRQSSKGITRNVAAGLQLTPAALRFATDAFLDHLRPSARVPHFAGWTLPDEIKPQARGRARPPPGRGCPSHPDHPGGRRTFQHRSTR